MEFEGSNILRKTSWYLGHLALSYIYLVDTENAECANCNIKDKQVRFLQLYFSGHKIVCFPFNLYASVFFHHFGNGFRSFPPQDVSPQRRFLPRRFLPRHFNPILGVKRPHNMKMCIISSYL